MDVYISYIHMCRIWSVEKIVRAYGGSYMVQRRIWIAHMVSCMRRDVLDDEDDDDVDVDQEDGWRAVSGLSERVLRVVGRWSLWSIRCIGHIQEDTTASERHQR